MAIFIDTPRYHVETGDPGESTIRVVRKKDGAYIDLDVDETGPGFLWLHAAGFKGSGMTKCADEWVSQLGRDCDPAPWTPPLPIWSELQAARQAKQVEIDKALAQEFGEPIPAVAH